MAEAPADLEEHRDTLCMGNEVAHLADDVERLGRDLRGLHRHCDELEWAVERQEC